MMPEREFEEEKFVFSVYLTPRVKNTMKVLCKQMEMPTWMMLQQAFKAYIKSLSEEDQAAIKKTLDSIG